MRFEVPSREVLALTGGTYPMIPIRNPMTKVYLLFKGFANLCRSRKKQN